MLEIINQRYMKLLFEISKKRRNISELAKKGDLTLSVASTLISRWSNSGVIIKEQFNGGRGKEIIITLTEYGKSQVELLKKINNNYQKNKDQISSLDKSLIEDKAEKEEKNDK